jgi:hypothetical protein
MKRLVTTFPHLARSVDNLRVQMLMEADIPDEEVELNAEHIIRSTNEIVTRICLKQVDARKQDNKIQDNKIRHRIERLDIQKERILRELKNNVLMSDSDREKHKEHVEIIEEEQDNLIRQLKNLKVKKLREPTREDELHRLNQKIMNKGKQIERLTADTQNMENSGVEFDREIHYNNINRINKEQEYLIQQHNKLKSKPEEDNINKFRIEKEREDDIFPDYIHNEVKIDKNSVEERLARLRARYYEIKIKQKKTR